MKIKTVALSVLIVQLVILALICWTWYNIFSADFGGLEGVMGIFLIAGTFYYFALTVCAYILFKKAEESKNFYLKILFVSVLSLAPLIYIYF